jgi:hypothetical protein
MCADGSNGHSTRGARAKTARLARARGGNTDCIECTEIINKGKSVRAALADAAHAG